MNTNAASKPSRMISGFDQSAADCRAAAAHAARPGGNDEGESDEKRGEVNSTPYNKEDGQHPHDLEVWLPACWRRLEQFQPFPRPMRAGKGRRSQEM